MGTLAIVRGGAAALGTIAVLFTAGCSASVSADDENSASDEGELAAQMTSGEWGFPDAVAMEFQRSGADGPTERLAFGTKLKVDNFFRGLEPIGQHTASDRRVPCWSGRIDFQLFDDKGRLLGVGGATCRDGWVLDSAHKGQRFFMAQGGGILEGAMVPTDLLWQIDEVEIKQAGGETATFKAGSPEIAKAVASVPAGARITNRNVSAACSVEPAGEGFWRSRTVSYRRRGREVARIGLGCDGSSAGGAGGRAVVADLLVIGQYGAGGLLPIERLSGTVPFDPTWLESALTPR